MKTLYPASVLVVGIILHSCSAMTGSHPYEQVRINSPTPVIVRDVYTRQVIQLDTIINDSETFTAVRLKNGRRHALAFETDSAVAYRTIGLKRNLWGTLNFFNYGLGCLIDQLMETNYDFEPEFLSKFTFNNLTQEQRFFIEDSLRNIERFSLPHSLLDQRTNFVVTVHGSMSITGPQASQLPFFNVFSYGVGLSPIPYIKVFYDYRTETTSECCVENAGGYLYQSAVSRTLGIAIQEPRFGFFGAWQYGPGTISYEADGDEELSAIKHQTGMTTYSLSVGFYGQWGRVEYRHMRITSIDNPTVITETPVVRNGVYWTVHIML